MNPGRNFKNFPNSRNVIVPTIIPKTHIYCFQTYWTSCTRILLRRRNPGSVRRWRMARITLRKFTVQKTKNLKKLKSQKKKKINKLPIKRKPILATTSSYSDADRTPPSVSRAVRRNAFIFYFIYIYFFNIMDNTTLDEKRQMCRKPIVNGLRISPPPPKKNRSRCRPGKWVATNPKSMSWIKKKNFQK